MKEKRKKSQKSKSRTNKRRSLSSSSSRSTDSDQWVEQETVKNEESSQREDWMSMTGMLKTYTKDDVKPKREQKDKKHIDSYNPSTSTRELNPYWKYGGTGLPQTPESFRQSRPFIKPNDSDEEDYYRKSKLTSSKGSESSSSKNYDDRSKSNTRRFIKPRDSDDDEDYYRKSRREDIKEKEHKDRRSHHDSYRTSNWKKQTDSEKSYEKKIISQKAIPPEPERVYKSEPVSLPEEKTKKSEYLSDEKMNKLAAKIVKAEIMGDTKHVTELKTKLEKAREYRKQHPNAQEQEDDRVMLIATSSSGNSRPLSINEKGDARSKSGKRKAETHVSGERTKYFGNDDRYDLAQMFQQEKYGNNYNDEAELARIASKSKNPNDDLEDIFLDEISKNRSSANDHENERQRAINQHVKMEKSLEGCEYCVDSKNMLKHLMVTCGNKVYLALPSRKSLVKNHCLITTIQHSTCATSLDEDVWAEIQTFREALTQFFNSQNMDVVFYEVATKLHKFPHIIINCVPLPRDVGDLASIYFKKALLECEAEWSMNKKVVDLRGKGIRRGIPKGLPYFWIDFGMSPGFAHVIEDQQLFPKSFAEEVIAGILDLDHSTWKNPRKEYGDLQRKKVLEFIKEWKPFEPTKN